MENVVRLRRRNKIVESLREVRTLSTGRVHKRLLLAGTTQETWSADKAQCVRLYYSGRMDLFYVDVYCTEQSKYLASHGYQNREAAYQCFERLVARHLTKWETK